MLIRIIFFVEKSYEIADYIAVNISSPNTKGFKRTLTSQELYRRFMQ